MIPIVQECIYADGDIIRRFAILYQRGYQDFDYVVSGLTTKVKGVVYTNFTRLGLPELNHRIYDVADYVNPPQVLFTNFFHN